MTYGRTAQNFAWSLGGISQYSAPDAPSQSGNPTPQTGELFEEWAASDLPDRMLVDRQGKVLWHRIRVSKDITGNVWASDLSKIKVGATLPPSLLLPILTTGAKALPGENRIALIEDADTRKNFVTRIVALGDPKYGPFGVTIISFHDFNDAQKADLKRIWDISAAEIGILAMTCRGMTAHEIAEDRDLSVETVRTHMRRIYTKVGVSSREGLFAAIGGTVG